MSDYSVNMLSIYIVFNEQLLVVMWGVPSAELILTLLFKLKFKPAKVKLIIHKYQYL